LVFCKLCYMHCVSHKKTKHLCKICRCNMSRWSSTTGTFSYMLRIVKYLKTTFYTSINRDYFAAYKAFSIELFVYYTYYENCLPINQRKKAPKSYLLTLKSELLSLNENPFECCLHSSTTLIGWVVASLC
jgi:hypothetical protein